MSQPSSRWSAPTRRRCGLTGRILLLVLPLFLAAEAPAAVEVNEDGVSLLQQASAAYAADAKGRPVLQDETVSDYVDGIVQRLVPEGRQPPSGVELRVAVIESSQPTLYSYIDGHILVSTGALFAMDNEAQLAGILAHEVAHLVEGHYLSVYQEIKAAERRQRKKAAAGALFGGLLDVAVSYRFDVEGIKATDRLRTGQATYRETLERMAAIHAAEAAYFSMRDVVDLIPEADEEGTWIDPRLRFEVVADAQGMEYLALAGYDVEEGPGGWERLQEIHSQRAREQEEMMGALAAQLRVSQMMAETAMLRWQASLGTSGLVQSPSEAPAARSELTAAFIGLQEVQAARAGRPGETGDSRYREFLAGVLLTRAETALREERYAQAKEAFRILYRTGIRSAAVSYGLAKSSLGDFAFAASEAEKQEAERLYREAAELDQDLAAPYLDLGALYEDWERYGDAIEAYRVYLKKAPDATDRGRIERRIAVLEKKVNR